MIAPLQKVLDTFKKLSGRERAVLYATVSVLGLVFIDRMILSPAIAKMNEIERRIKDEESQIRTNLKILLQKDRIREESRELNEFAPPAKTSEEEMTSLLREIEVLADRSSVSLLYVRPSTTKEEPDRKRFMATLEIESEMQPVAGFFHAVESSPKLLRIEKFEIAPKSKESSLVRCVLTVSKTVLT